MNLSLSHFFDVYDDGDGREDDGDGRDDDGDGRDD